jgi:hypothetical protein
MNVILSPSFVSTQRLHNQASFSTEPSRLRPNQVVFETSPSASAQQESNENAPVGKQVFKVSELNTLVYQGRQHNLQRSQNTTQNASGSHDSIIVWGQNDNLDTNQHTAFEILASTYVLTFYKDAEDATGNEALIELDDLRNLARRRENDDKKLIMFITGPAGAGKCKSSYFNNEPSKRSILTTSIARILKSLLAYTKAFSKNIGHHFTSDTIRISAITGSAAIAIEGDTTCRQFGLAKSKVDLNDIAKCADTRMNIVDEISFATKELLVKLSDNTQALSEYHDSMYGKIPMVFLGDFCQLEGIGGSPIFSGAPSMY